MNRTVQTLNARIFELESILVDRDAQILDLHMRLQEQLDIKRVNEPFFASTSHLDFIPNPKRPEPRDKDTESLPPLKVSVAERIARARKLRDDGEVLVAQMLLRDVLEEGPNEMAYLDLASCFYLQQRFDDAKQMLHRVLELNPSNGKALMNMAMILYVQDSSPEGISLSRSYYLAAIEAEETPDLSFEALLFPVEIKNDKSLRKEQKRKLKREKKERKKLEKQLKREQKKLREQQRLELKQQELNRERMEQARLENQRKQEQELKRMQEQQQLEQQKILEREKRRLKTLSEREKLELNKLEEQQKLEWKQKEQQQKELEKNSLNERKKLEQEKGVEQQQKERVELEMKRRLEFETERFRQQIEQQSLEEQTQ